MGNLGGPVWIFPRLLSWSVKVFLGSKSGRYASYLREILDVRLVGNGA